MYLVTLYRKIWESLILRFLFILKLSITDDSVLQSWWRLVAPPLGLSDLMTFFACSTCSECSTCYSESPMYVQIYIYSLYDECPN